MLDLNHKSGAKLSPSTLSDKINAVIDVGIVTRKSREPARNYLGASTLGDPCARRLVYIATNTPTDEPLTAKTIRIFDVGHVTEDFLAGASEFDAVFTNAAVRWFHDAGFDLRTRDSKGQQFRWSALGGRISGAIDGVFCGGPEIDGLAYPVLWEAKSANKKNWSKFRKHGVRVGSETYNGQAQLNMAYLDVGKTLFTFVNKDTSEIFHELVDFDPAVAQRLSDRAFEVITMADKGELPERIATNPDYWMCKMCGFYKRCWQP
jgi:hypothetical protein